MTSHTSKSFLLATWEGGGSVAPMLTVARKLRAKGHRVRVMSDACNRLEAEAAGAQFVPWTRAPSRSDRTPASDLVRDWEYEGPAGLIQVMDAVWAGPALAYAQDIMAELRREPADLVVTNEYLFGVIIGCQALGQPYCLFMSNVCLFPMPGVPPLGPGLAPAKTEADRALHEEVSKGVIGMFDAVLPAVNAARKALGLRSSAHTVDLLADAAGALLATARAFDFAPEALPPGMRYVGPQMDEPAWAEPWVSPWPNSDRRPLVLVGFSTTFQNHAAVLQRVIDALEPLPVRGLVTLGGSIGADELRPSPNVRLVESAPHDAVMQEAALVVTHGGHGTVIRALTHRLPMLVVPHGRDQNDNAVRVTERGAGLALPATASAEEIGAALARLLNEPGFALAARRLGGAVAREVAQSPVVEALEELAQNAGARLAASTA
ncbi:MAG TPA: glycosyltransferase [Caulobacteraceae bacterium]|nr:glycosyltransferase [Caulobacteraceae bacterium]